jgi:hypothetical protein
MPGYIGKTIKFARTPAGRKVLAEAVRIARSEEGRKLIAQARKVATSPEGKRLLAQATQLVKPAPPGSREAEEQKAWQALRDRWGGGKR